MSDSCKIYTLQNPLGLFDSDIVSCVDCPCALRIASFLLVVAHAVLIDCRRSAMTLAKRSKHFALLVGISSFIVCRSNHTNPVERA